MLYMLYVIARIVVPITVIIQINDSNRWITIGKTLLLHRHAKQQTHLPSLPVSGTDPSQTEDKYNLHY